MTIRRLPGPVSDVTGRVEIPTSKSLTNRALIASAAADGGCIQKPLDCEDTRLLAAAIKQAGWPLTWAREITIGPRHMVDHAVVDLGNSGTGARLVLGLLASVPGRFEVDGTDRLRERPMSPLISALTDLGSEIHGRDGFLPVHVVGRQLDGGFVQIRPEVSSQFVSSLMLAGPRMTQGIDLEVVGAVPSRPYLDLTREVMTAFGASVDLTPTGHWVVEPGGLRSTTYSVEGDWSAAAFAAAAVAVAGGEITIAPLSAKSSQGDRVLVAILERAGLEIRSSDSGVKVSGRMTRPFDADLTDAPDLFPALVVVATTGPEGSVFRGLDHLKHKESDRLSVMVENLGRLGACFATGPSWVRVQKGVSRDQIGPKRVTAADDHRIAMSMAVAAMAAGELELDDDRCVAKSFPDFWRMWSTLVKGKSDRP